MDTENEEIIQAIIKERKRCIEIANDFWSKHNEEFENSKRAGNTLAFVKYEMAETARYVANAISGLNGLSFLSETVESMVRKEQSAQASVASKAAQSSER